MPTDEPRSGSSRRRRTTSRLRRRDAGREPGYETTDVNVGGVIVFLAGLFGFVLIFFCFCFVMGSVINSGAREAGWADRQVACRPDCEPVLPARAVNGKREDLTSNAAMEQQELQQMTTTFPQPGWRWTTATRIRRTCTRARICCWSTTARCRASGAIRIPIERAMELIAQRGLPVMRSRGADAADCMAGDEQPTVHGSADQRFCATGYELDAIEAREQKIELRKQRRPHRTHAELKPSEVSEGTVSSVMMKRTRQMTRQADNAEVAGRRRSAACCCRCCTAAPAVGAGLELRRQADGEKRATSCRRCCRRLA